MTSKPLEGIRVLDVTQHVAGPVATLMLGFLGAQVIKVETPWLADLREMTSVVPPQKPNAANRPWNRVPPFNDVNRGKLSIALDLAKAEGKAVFRTLAIISDVVIDNFSPRVMRNLALDHEHLKKLRPDIIVVSVSGYGATGPYQNWTAAGPSIDAASGISHLTGYPGGPPLRPGNYNADFIAGCFAAFATIAALSHRRQTGQGQFVDVAMREAMTHFIGEALISYMMESHSPPRTGNENPNMAPHGCFPCRGEDAWVTIAVRSDEEWDALCSVMGNPPWCRDERFDDALSRWQNRETLHTYLARWTSQQDKFAVMAALQTLGISAGAVLNFAEVLSCPPLRERGHYLEIDHPEVGPAPFPQLGWRFSHSLSGASGRAPLYAEHNIYTFHDLLGMSTAELEELLEQQVTTYEPRQR